MKWRNISRSSYHYSVDPNIGKGVCDILQITCKFTAYVVQLDKNGHKIVLQKINQDMNMLKTPIITKILGNYNNLIIIKFLDNKKLKE